ncbi:hypothetical protein PIB30_039673, partial [Stylosanthes scabra]|nr:hypothetical protein [Stylosanthes scabra]
NKVPQLPTLSVFRKFSLCVFTVGVNSATHLKTPFPVNFSQNRRPRRARKDPKPWDTKFRSERRFVELETRSPENAPVAGIPRLKTTTRQNQRNLQELEIEELRQQIQRLQGIVEIQQAQLNQHMTAISD